MAQEIRSTVGLAAKKECLLEGAGWGGRNETLRRGRGLFSEAPFGPVSGAAFIV